LSPRHAAQKSAALLAQTRADNASPDPHVLRLGDSQYFFPAYCGIVLPSTIAPRNEYIALNICKHEAV
jgi:hypothetical protein